MQRTVKDLIAELSTCDPNTVVEFHVSLKNEILLEVDVAGRRVVNDIARVDKLAGRTAIILDRN